MIFHLLLILSLNNLHATKRKCESAYTKQAQENNFP